MRLHKLEAISDNLGPLRSVHGPSTIRIWLMGLLTLGPLCFFTLGVILIFDSIVHSRRYTTLGNISTAVGFTVVIGLLMALLLGLTIQQLRQWLPTRKVVLRIFENGFNYQDVSGGQSCRWDEIKDVTHRTLMVHSKHAPPRRTSVIRSIIKTDGTVIVLAETLDMQRITGLIDAAAKAPR